ncbi:MAG: hypothetical protein AB7N80_11665 [Bdellovibrionales bacterium]
MTQIKTRLGKAFILSVGLLLGAGCGDALRFNQKSDKGILMAAEDGGEGSYVDPDAPCTFNGVEVPIGASVVAYQNSTEPFGGSCQSEVRLCTGGVLSGSYAYAACEVGAPAACLFGGQTVPHLGAVMAYQSSAVAFGGVCQGENRVCRNGVLSGSFEYPICDVGAPAGCLFDGRMLLHNETVVAFLTTTVPFGTTCNSQPRICQNGTLSGNYMYGNCTVGAPAGCAFNGRTLAHGESVTAFARGLVAYNEDCVGQTRRCQNGVLSGSFTAESCTRQDAPLPPVVSGKTYYRIYSGGDIYTGYPIKIYKMKATEAQFMAYQPYDDLQIYDEKSFAISRQSGNGPGPATFPDGTVVDLDAIYANDPANYDPHNFGMYYEPYMRKMGCTFYPGLYGAWDGWYWRLHGKFSCPKAIF